MFRFYVFLKAPTSHGTKMGQAPLTYLNHGEAPPVLARTVSAGSCLQSMRSTRTAVLSPPRAGQSYEVDLRESSPSLAKEEDILYRASVLD